MNKPFYLYLSILHLSEPIMYEFWYDYIKPKSLEMQILFIWLQTASLPV